MIGFRSWWGQMNEALLGWLACCGLGPDATPEPNWPCEVGVRLPHCSRLLACAFSVGLLHKLIETWGEVGEQSPSCSTGHSGCCLDQSCYLCAEGGSRDLARIRFEELPRGQIDMLHT